MTYITLEELMKQAYHEYFMRIAELVNFAGICRQAGVNYTNFRQFMTGKYNYMSVEKLARICEVIRNIEKIA